jgi:hypothetical protein
MRAVPWIIAAIGVIALTLVGLLLAPRMSWTLGSGSGSGMDNTARIEIERMRFQMENLVERITQLENQIRQLEQDAPAPLEEGPVATGDLSDRYTEVVVIPRRREFNEGMTVATPDVLKQMLGAPRDVLSDECEPMTNARLQSMLRLQSVGPIRVNMLAPAVDSLRAVFEQVRVAEPDLYKQIRSSGSLCVRQIRASSQRASSHAFGLAVDVNIAGILDNFSDGNTQLGLIILADYFQSAGWIWGAGFRREDSMHFEVSQELLETWRGDGKI